MKLIAIIIIFMFFTACSSFTSSQKIIHLETYSNETAVNKTPNIAAEINAANLIPKENITKEIEQETIRISQQNITLSNGIIAKKMSKGTDHTIEVIDVTETEDGCLIKVDGVTDLINKGTTKTISGLRIYVVDVRAMHTALQDKDLCQLVIA